MIHSGSYDAETDRRNVFKAAYFLKGSWNKAASEMGIKNKDQSHYCGEKPKTIDEYILSQDADKQEDLLFEMCLKQHIF